jgi:xanthine dehydrogenase YagS FAD-binding subunit
MQPFTFTTMPTAKQASEKQQSTEDTMLLGGGTNLIDMMKIEIMRPQHLLDVRKIAAPEVRDKGTTVIIAGTATNSGVAHHELIMREFPVLSQAILSGASPQLRNMATVAGNIMQRTRCSYFRDTVMRCNKRTPGSGCDAIDGYNRMNAVLGGSEHCIAVNPSDMNVALSMLDAVVHVTNGSKRREIPFPEFHVMPEDHPEIETVLQPGDVITAVEISKSPLARQSHYLKVRDRAEFSFALTSAAVALTATAGVISQARLALGGVATKPWRAVEAEKLLSGQLANKEAFRAAAESALKGAKPQSHNAFKIELGKRTIVRAFQELQQQA